MKIYFDNAATTPIYPEVLKRMTEVLENTLGNPSSTHAAGRKAKSVIENSRKQIAKVLNASPSEIIFTSGGTEANNFILRSAIRDLGIEVVISSAIEHHAVLHTLEALKNEYPIELVYVPLTEKGAITLPALEFLLEKYIGRKVLVSLMHINNEIGNLLPLKEVALLCKGKGAFFHSDTVQSVGHYPIDLQDIPVDFITASAHKFHGPKGIGFAFVRKGSALHSLLFGGEQEKGLRAGTESVHNIAGMEEAFRLSYERLIENSSYLIHLKEYFIEKIRDAFPSVLFNGECESLDSSSFTIVNIGIPELQEKNDTLLFALDLKGVACSKGSACQSGSLENSHVLSAFLPPEKLKIPSLRCSFSAFNTKEEVDIFINILRGMTAYS